MVCVDGAGVGPGGFSLFFWPLEAVQRNKPLDLAGIMSLERQLAVLQSMIAGSTTPPSLGRELLACAFFAAEKDANKHVLAFNFHPQGVLSRIVPLVEFALEATGEKGFECTNKGSTF